MKKLKLKICALLSLILLQILVFLLQKKIVLYTFLKKIIQNLFYYIFRIYHHYFLTLNIIHIIHNVKIN